MQQHAMLLVELQYNSFKLVTFMNAFAFLLMKSRIFNIFLHISKMSGTNDRTMSMTIQDLLLCDIPYFAYNHWSCNHIQCYFTKRSNRCALATYICIIFNIIFKQHATKLSKSLCIMRQLAVAFDNFIGRQHIEILDY